MQNNPKQELYNGTTGILIRKNGVGTAYFAGESGIRTIGERALPLFEVAFCLSIHKSQGSEFDEVLILFGPGSERFGKAALYTGVTRAKKKVEICAEESAFQAAIAKKTNYHSGFSDRFLMYKKLEVQGHRGMRAPLPRKQIARLSERPSMLEWIVIECDVMAHKR